MQKTTFKVTKREQTGRAVKKLRATGLVPANIFGKQLASQNIQLPAKEFLKLRREVGESSLIYLQVEGEKDDHPVIVRELTVHPVSGQLLHVSFNQVSLKEKITAPVAVEITGEAPAEKDGLGILVQQLQEIEIEALPTDIPESISADVSSLTEVDAAVLVKDLKIDASKITVTTDPESIVAKIQPLAAEEKEEAPAPAEGEAPAAGVVDAETPPAGTEVKPEAEEKKD